MTGRRAHRLLGRPLAATIATLALLVGTLAACTPPPGGTTPTPFIVGGSVRQVYVIVAPPQSPVTLRDGNGATVQTGTTDSLGGFLFKEVTPGAGYRVVAGSTTSNPVTVMAPDDVPPPSLYTNQRLNVVDSGTGYGYLTTRDGTKLSVQVQLPGRASGGPYPTVLEYSGYDPSNPTSAVGTSPYKLIASLLGYAYVGVNVRGSGCSGGAFDYFEYLQSLDGYDAVETIATQPWAGKIGTVGISYPGNSQLFVAQTRPPHLAAISPLSVIDDNIRSTLAPGGIKNDGFAIDWINDRIKQNRWPDPSGAGWVVDRLKAGDIQCAYNMLLRQQNADLLGAINRRDFYPAVGDPDYPPGGDQVAPWTWAHKINVPVFIAGAWQDEQTGGRWPDMLDRFTSVPRGELKVTATNGTHSESLDPEILSRLVEFLQFNLESKIPSIPPFARAFAPLIYQQITGIPNILFPPDRFSAYTDFAAAKTAYEAEPPVRILWETGAAPGQTPGAPLPVTETSYSQWPAPQMNATAWYLQPDGKLAATPPSVPDGSAREADSYTSDPAARPRSNYSGSSSGIWRADPIYDWRPLVDGKALSFLSDPLAAPVSMLGSGSVDLWIKSTAADTDLQVTLTEVRSDDSERYVQNGWLRSSFRKVDAANSTELLPRHTGLEVDAAPLPAGEFSLARVELFPFAHTFRAGTRIRISVQAPGGDRPLWTFITPPGGEVNSVAHSVGHASRIVLPVVPTVALPADPAPCPSLRSQPCRAYVAPANPTGVTAALAGTDVNVSWTAAPTPTGKTITGYTVTASTGLETQTVAPDATITTFTGLTPGTYSFTVVANYADGESPPSSPSNDVVVPVPEPPKARITSGPDARTRSRTATFTFSAPGAASYACSFDLQPLAPCASPVSRTNLRRGVHVFVVVAKDAAGRAGPPAVRIWRIR